MFIVAHTLLALVAGGALGLLYFGGLWWTVQRLPTASQPALLALASFWGRLAVCVSGFYLVTQAQWLQLLVCLLGFLCARSLLVRSWGMKPGYAKRVVSEG